MKMGTCINDEEDIIIVVKTENVCDEINESEVKKSENVIAALDTNNDDDEEEEEVALHRRRNGLFSITENLRYHKHVMQNKLPPEENDVFGDTSSSDPLPLRPSLASNPNTNKTPSHRRRQHHGGGNGVSGERPGGGSLATTLSDFSPTTIHHHLNHHHNNNNNTSPNNNNNNNSVKNERLSPGAGSTPETASRSRSATPGSASHPGTPPASCATVSIVTTSAVEGMLGRNYSDFMRSLAAKYNNTNPNDYFSAVRNGFPPSSPLDPRCFKPSSYVVSSTTPPGALSAATTASATTPMVTAAAAAAAATLFPGLLPLPTLPPGSSSNKDLARHTPPSKDATNQSQSPIIGGGGGMKQQPPPPAAADFAAATIFGPFASAAAMFPPLIDMSSTQTLIALARTAKEAELQNLLKNVKRPDPTSPLDLSSATTASGGGGGPSAAKRSRMMMMTSSSAMSTIITNNKTTTTATPSSSASSGGSPNSRCTSTVPPPPHTISLAKRACSESPRICDDTISSWTVEDVCTFVAGIDICAEYVQTFRDQSIDGAGLPLLTEEHLTTKMSMKLGPALKLRSILARKLGNCALCLHCQHCHNNSANNTNNLIINNNNSNNSPSPDRHIIINNNNSSSDSGGGSNS